jgi:HEAT repeat protein
MWPAIRSARSYAAAQRDLAHAEARVRAEAAADLARHAEAHRAEVIASLEGALADEAPLVRAAAAMSLADVGAVEAAAALVRALDDEAAMVRQAALIAVGELGPAHAAGALGAVEGALIADEPALRFQAVMAFARLCEDHDRVVAALLRATRDDDPEICHVALRMAEEHGARGCSDAGEAEPVDARIVERAAELCDHESAEVRLAAAVILGRAGRAEGRAHLCAAAARELATREKDDESAAIELCGELELREAIPALERRAFASDWLWRADPFAWHARVALARLGHARAVAWVLAELRALSRERRTLAVAAAGRARLVEARASLEEMARDPARADPDAVREALAALGDR